MTDLATADIAAMAKATADQGAHRDAAGLWAQACAREPDNEGYFVALTHGLVKAGDPHAALRACDAAQDNLPRPILARVRRGQILYHDLADHMAAQACFEDVLALDETNATAHYGLARLALDRLDLDLARRHGALALDRVDERAALWLLIWVLGEYEAALELSARLLAADPADLDLLAHRGRALYLLRRNDEALAMFARIIEHSPHQMEGNFGLAEMLLLAGDARAGWRRFDALVSDDLLRAVPPAVRPSLETFWRGEPLDGKRILVVHFLGIGDNIMMARFVRSLNARGAHVTFCCRPELYRLFQGLEGVDDLWASYNEQPWSAFDYWTFDYLLPRWLGGSDNAIPAYERGYVAPPSISDALTRDSLSARGPGRLRVGLCWASAPVHFTGATRFVRPEALAPLAAVPDIDWFVVQKGPFNAGFAARSGLAVTDLSPTWSDFHDTAILMTTLDLVISIDSSPLHLAGALGVPAWGLICAAPDWKWGARGDFSPWYPQIRLFRQKRLDDWAPVIEAVAVALRLCTRP